MLRWDKCFSVFVGSECNFHSIPGYEDQQNKYTLYYSQNLLELKVPPLFYKHFHGMRVRDQCMFCTHLYALSTLMYGRAILSFYVQTSAYISDRIMCDILPEYQ